MAKGPFPSLGIYIHVPFCIKKCPYCSFYSEIFDKELAVIYTKALSRSIKTWGDRLAKQYYVDTIYLGGGTPLLLGESNIYKIFNTIGNNFRLNIQEITIESNPGSSDEVSFCELKKMGINRVSIGMQSTNNFELKSLGRQHSHKQTVNVINKVRKAGIDNISLDVMLNIPYQTKESLAKTLKFCKNSGAKHVSAYMLKIEEGTQFFKLKNELNLCSEEEQCENYINTVLLLEDLGFKQYEISNFSNIGFYSKHNLKYWNIEDYLGLGPSAHSLIGYKRFYYKDSLKDFVYKDSPIVECQKMIPEEEYTMLQLRLNEGLVNEKYLKKFGKSIPKKYFKNAILFEKLELAKVISDNRISLTTKGFLLSNRIISDILFNT